MYALGPFLRKLSHLVNFNDLPLQNSLKSYFTKNTASKKWQDRRTIEIATELHIYAISKGKYNGHMQGRCLTAMVTCKEGASQQWSHAVISYLELWGSSEFRTQDLMQNCSRNSFNLRVSLITHDSHPPPHPHTHTHTTAYL